MRGREMILRWLPAIVWMMVIFFASSLSGRELSAVSGYSFYGHLGEYTILGVLLFLAVRPTWPRWRPMLLTIALASAYGVTDELHQFLTPGRTPDPLDWATDTLGALLGVALVLLAEAAFRRRAR